MKIFITGATGLIGRKLVAALLEKKYKVTALSRFSIQAKKILSSQVEVVSSLGYSSFDEFDAVINLAGEPIFAKYWTEAQKQKLVNSRLNLTKQLVELINASTNRPQVFISGSAIGFYGDRQEQFLDEDSLKGSGFTAQLSAQWEQVAQAANTRVCLLRTGFVLAQEGGALGAMLPLYRYGLGGKIGSGQQYWSWIHIDDMVKGILFLLEKSDCQGAFNFCSPNSVKNNEFSRHLAQVLGRPNIAIAPACILRIILGERSTLLLDSQRAYPEKLLKLGFQFQYPELSKGLHSLLEK